MSKNENKPVEKVTTVKHYDPYRVRSSSVEN